MLKRRLFVVFLLLLASHLTAAQKRPSISYTDRTRLAEAFNLSKLLGNRIWQGWTKVPFAVLLVTPDAEFLLRHPEPSRDFTPLGYDSLLQTEVYFRRRTYQKNLLATFPAIQSSRIPVIVVGQAERTQARTSTRWVITLFHEHFHQLQYSQPTYYEDLNALNLAHGDQSGMWVLNYSFPYTDAEVQNRFTDLSRLLVEGVNSKPKDRRDKLNRYLEARQQFAKFLSPDDYKYFSFQFWQEGIARYTEFRVAALASSYKPSKEFRDLKDFTAYREEAEATRARIIKQLLTQQLSESRREVVYPFGAAEGLLLDRVKPSWQDRYFVDKFDLGKYYSDSR